MNNNPSNGYNPVTNYMEQYVNSVRYDPETKQYVSDNVSATAAQYPAAQQQAYTVPAFAAQQQAYTVPSFVAPPSSVSQPRLNPLDNTVKTDSAKKPFRRLASQVGFSMVLYIVFDFIIGYLIIYMPYLFNLGKALANTEAAALFSKGEYLEAYRTVIEYVQTIVSEDALTTCHLIATILGAAAATFLPMLILAKKNGFKAFSVLKKGKKYGNGLAVKGMFAAFAVTFVWSVIYQFLSALFPAIGNSDMGMELPDYLPATVLYVFYVVICAPLFEEFIFRGVMLKALTPYGTLFASMVTALLFGLLHGNLQQTPFAFAVGLIFAYIAIKTGSIRTGIILHFLVNGLSTSLQLISQFCSDTVITVASLLVILFYGSAILVTIIVLIADRKKISFIQQPEDGNNIVLPVKQEQPRKKWLHTVTALGMIIFLIYIIYYIVASTGVFAPAA